MHLVSRRARTARLLATSLFVAPSLAYAFGGQQEGYNPNRTVGPQADGSIVASDNQTLTPAGQVVVLGAPVRAKAVAVNPNSKTNTAAVLTMGSQQGVIVFNTVTGAIVQTIPSGGSFNGIAYSADGTKLFFNLTSEVVQLDVDATNGQIIYTTAAAPDGSAVALPSVSAANPNPPYPYYNGSLVNPGGIALSPDGAHAYDVLNAANALGVINASALKDGVVSTFQAQVSVGNAPNSVVISADGHYAYVSNEGGRRAVAGDYTNPSDGAAIVADANDAYSITGTVSVVDLTSNTVVDTIEVGLHPTGMTISGSYLYVANAYSDTISVIDLNTSKVVSTIDVGVPIPGSDHGDTKNANGSVVEAAASRRAWGSGPNAITIVNGSTAYVTLGNSNAIAVIDLAPFANRVVGYIPTAYYPTSVAYDSANKQLVVANDKGIGAQEIQYTNYGVTGYSTYQEGGVVTLIPLPNAGQLAKYTEQVINNNHWSALNPSIFVGPEFVDRSARPAPVPRHIGEPSTIKHVFLIIKENRTYDQVLGDVPQGNGDASLAVFGQQATPNQHALIKRFPLLDNIYAPSRVSGDGHVWIVSSGAFYSSEIESPDFIRSYSQDSLTYTPRGELWSAAQKKGLSVAIYGENGVGAGAGAPQLNGPILQPNPANGEGYTWSDFYNTAMCIEGKIAAATCQTLTQVPFTAINDYSLVPSANGVFDHQYLSSTLAPDQYKLDYWISTFERQVSTNTVPNLTIMWLPDDHTDGTASGWPAPINCQADNDLAVGRLVETISQSRVWESSAIFVEEDDAQNGVDHIDGHRMPAYVISPWTAPRQAADAGKVIHTIYTQININRTIEQILGLEPMTQLDLVASPMFDVFGEVPDLTPWTHVPATTPLNQSADGTYLGWTGLGANFGELELTPLQKAWIDASNEMIKGKVNIVDNIDFDFLNHAVWYSATNWNRPYPGEGELKMPDEFVKAAAAKPQDDDDDHGKVIKALTTAPQEAHVDDDDDK